MSTLTLTGTAGPHQSQSYTHLPFEVPPNTGRIEVSYSYTDEVGSDPTLTDGNTVDIGIFDPRGIHFLTEGFRGWSGSARHSFYLSQSDATPGYMPGVIQPGTWHICLGLYKIAEQGCQFTVEITLTPLEAGQIAQTALPTLLPMRDTVGGNLRADHWYCGDIHNHSYNSDGDSDPLEIIRHAEDIGLDFFAMTDHNVLTHQIALNTVKTSLVLIPGCEVTTYKGHWNVWGDHGWIDFRVTEEGHMRAAADEATRRGYFRSLNHPKPYGPEWAYPAVDDYDSIEVWNGPWPFFNDDSLAFWEERLKEGRRIPAVGGSDAHFYQRDHHAKLGQPLLWVYTQDPLTAFSVLEAIRRGHVMISESPEGPRVFITSGDAMMGDSLPRPAGKLTLNVTVERGAGDVLQVITSDGLIEQPITETVQKFTFEVEADHTPYVRAQVADKSQTAFIVRALTNPIYLD
jgi:hypothetical protein